MVIYSYVSLQYLQYKRYNIKLYILLHFYKTHDSQKTLLIASPSLFKNCLNDLGYDSSQFGLHSLRLGGATAAVRNNENLSERALKMNRRWKSTNAKDMYIVDDVAERLKASSGLRL